MLHDMGVDKSNVDEATKMFIISLIYTQYRGRVRAPNENLMSAAALCIRCNVPFSIAQRQDNNHFKI